MPEIELSLAAKFLLTTQTKLIEGCTDLEKLREVAIQLLNTNAATKALLAFHMREAMQAPFTVHPGKPPVEPPPLAPKPQRKWISPNLATEQRWHLCHDERGAHYRWGLRQDLIDQGANPDEVGHE